jgi:hypothetical protein
MAYVQSSLPAAPTAATLREEAPAARRRRVWPVAIPVAMVTAAAITSAVWLRSGAEAGATSAPALDFVGTRLAPDAGRTMTNHADRGTADGAKSNADVAATKPTHDGSASSHGRDVDGSNRDAARGHAQRKAAAGSRKPKPAADAEPATEPAKPAAWDPDSPTFPTSK